MKIYILYHSYTSAHAYTRTNVRINLKMKPLNWQWKNNKFEKKNFSNLSFSWKITSLYILYRSVSLLDWDTLLYKIYGEWNSIDHRQFFPSLFIHFAIITWPRGRRGQFQGKFPLMLADWSVVTSWHFWLDKSKKSAKSKVPSQQKKPIKHI